MDGGKAGKYLDSRTASNKDVAAVDALYSSAVLQYLTTKVQELTTPVLNDFNDKCTTADHLNMAIRANEELDCLIKATVAGGGKIPHLHQFLNGKKENDVEDPQEENNVKPMEQS